MDGEGRMKTKRVDLKINECVDSKLFIMLALYEWSGRSSWEIKFFEDKIIATSELADLYDEHASKSPLYLRKIYYLRIDLKVIASNSSLDTFNTCLRELSELGEYKNLR